MGQLERYGLYVLCLVIFLILGVAIWGGDSSAVKKAVETAERQEQPLHSEESHIAELERMLEKRDRFAEKRQDLAEGLFHKAAEPEIKGADAKPAGGEEKPKEKEQARPEPKPEPAAARVHRVAKGDTLGAIAEKYLGRSALWPKIAEANPGVTPKNLVPGTELKIPGGAAAGAGGGNDVKVASAADEYRVQKNDSAWRIAEKHYGKKNAKRYADAILALNRISDPQELREGTVIKLPPR